MSPNPRFQWSALVAERQATPVWIALIIGGCLCLSTVFACATPFAALASLAVLTCRRGPALALVGLAWIGNQAIGYGLLGYPWTWDSLAWGLAIGLSALAGAMAAMSVARIRSRVALVLPFLAAFTVYEAGLYAVSFLLPGGQAGFALAVIGYVFLVNVVGFVALLLAYQLVKELARLAERAHAAMPSRS